MTALKFDDGGIHWNRLEGINHMPEAHSVGAQEVPRRAAGSCARSVLARSGTVTKRSARDQPAVRRTRLRPSGGGGRHENFWCGKPRRSRRARRSPFLHRINEMIIAIGPPKWMSAHPELKRRRARYPSMASAAPAKSTEAAVKQTAKSVEQKSAQ